MEENETDELVIVGNPYTVDDVEVVEPAYDNFESALKSFDEERFLMGWKHSVEINREVLRTAQREDEAKKERAAKRKLDVAQRSEDASERRTRSKYTIPQDFQ